MSLRNCDRGGCVDVFRTFLLKNAHLKGEFDLPAIKPVNEVPRKLIRFSKAVSEKKDFNQWICFYEDDFQFERIWNNPKKYLNVISKFRGVISPDFSLYYDMPLAMQIWNIYRSRAIASWLQNNGIKVVPNIRFGDFRTIECACSGISKNSIIAVGSLGCINAGSYKKIFESGLEKVVQILQPEYLIIYGSLTDNIKDIKKVCPNVICIEPDSHPSKKEVE